jgi:chorismate synthase
VALIKIKNAPCGLGEPIYYKFDSILANAMMSINGVKGIDIGLGHQASNLTGLENNDPINENGFVSNNSGGILGGISNGDDIEIKVYFKPTPSIFKEQQTVDKNNNEILCNLKGRHDPCIAVRGSIVAESMAAIVTLDLLLLNMSSKIDNIKKIYLN